ncbi:energy transducer TonB, partial [Leisingera sp. ANG-Vp]|uniref:energy transducer TonB n=1 Tax=Leisingera sp. ANG-Vp TaxID=1577896 RepID=UPI00057D4609
PPQAIEQIETATAEPPLQAAAPALPQIDAPQAPRAAVRLAMTEPAAADNLQIDTAAPPPPPPPKAQTPSKPQEREVPPRNANSSRNAAGQAGQQAADSGGGAQAGQSGGAQTATASSGREAKLRSVWGNKIRARIERRKRYPSAARGQARVVVRLIVSRSGQLLDYRIAKSSGISAFDQAALAAVSRAGKFPPAPKKLQASQIRLSLPISFTK